VQVTARTRSPDRRRRIPLTPPIFVNLFSFLLRLSYLFFGLAFDYILATVSSLPPSPSLSFFFSRTGNPTFCPLSFAPLSIHGTVFSASEFFPHLLSSPPYLSPASLLDPPAQRVFLSSSGNPDPARARARLDIFNRFVSLSVVFETWLVSHFFASLLPH